MVYGCIMNKIKESPLLNLQIRRSYYVRFPWGLDLKRAVRSPWMTDAYGNMYYLHSYPANTLRLTSRNLTL
jgi:hypothetical protein